MPGSEPIEIGSVAAVKGQVFADFGDGVRPLAVGAPVHLGESIITKAGSNVEILFKDDTVLAEGENSHIHLDKYAYDPGQGGGGDLLFKMAEGAFKVVTGKIADNNPEKFVLKSPLATIGIRGTTVVSEIRGGLEKHGAEEIHTGKALTIQNALGQVQLVTSSRGMVDFRPDGSMSAPRPFSVQEIQHFQTVTPIQSVPGFTAPPPPPASGGQQQGGQQQGGQQQGGQQGNQEGQQGGQEGQGQQGQGGGTGTGAGEGAGTGTGTGAGTGLGGGAIGGVFGGSGGSGGLGGLGGSALLAGGVAGDVGGLKISLGPATGPASPDTAPQLLTGPGIGVLSVIIQTEAPPTPSNSAVLNDESDKLKELEQQASQSSGTDTGGVTTPSSAGVYLTATTAGETLVGTERDDILVGMGGRNWLEGHGGNDILIGGSYDGRSMLGDIASFKGIATGVYASLATNLAYVDGKATAMVNVMGLRGGDGNDTLIGNASSNYLEGGLGDDTLYGAATTATDLEDDVASYMHASGGVTVDLNLTLDVSGAAQYGQPQGTPYGTSAGADGHDALFGIENLIGSEYADTLTGNAKENWFQGRGGADSITGGSGTTPTGERIIDAMSFEDQGHGVTVNLSSQIMTGGDAADMFTGIEGVDGTAFADSLTGDGGNNWFTGNGGDDTIDGGGHAFSLGGSYDGVSYANAPSLAGGAGVYVDLDLGTATGGDGNDLLTGINEVEGSRYADLLVGSAEANWFEGDAGNDTIYGGDTAEISLDVASYEDATGAVTVNLDQGSSSPIVLPGGSTTLSGGGVLGTATGADGNDILVNIEGIKGSGYCDLLTGNTQANWITGGLGNDTILGKGGADTLEGGYGNDLFLEEYSLTSSTTIDGGAGMDSLTLTHDGVTTNVLDNVTNVEKIAFGNAATKITTVNALVAPGQTLWVDASSLAGTNSLTWTGSAELDGNFSILGGAWSDTVTGGAGSTSFCGGVGNDTLFAGVGTNAFDGGAGTDLLSESTRAAAVTFTLASPYAGSATDGTHTDTFQNVEAFTGSSQSDTMVLGNGDMTLTTSSVETIVYRGGQTGQKVVSGPSSNFHLDVSGVVHSGDSAGIAFVDTSTTAGHYVLVGDGTGYDLGNWTPAATDAVALDITFDATAAANVQWAQAGYFLDVHCANGLFGATGADNLIWTDNKDHPDFHLTTAQLGGGNDTLVVSDLPETLWGGSTHAHLDLGGGADMLVIKPSIYQQTTHTDYYQYGDIVKHPGLSVDLTNAGNFLLDGHDTTAFNSGSLAWELVHSSTTTLTEGASTIHTGVDNLALKLNGGLEVNLAASTSTTDALHLASPTGLTGSVTLSGTDTGSHDTLSLGTGDMTLSLSHVDVVDLGSGAAGNKALTTGDASLAMNGSTIPGETVSLNMTGSSADVLNLNNCHASLNLTGVEGINFANAASALTVTSAAGQDHTYTFTDTGLHSTDKHIDVSLAGGADIFYYQHDSDFGTLSWSQPGNTIAGFHSSEDQFKFASGSYGYTNATWDAAAQSSHFFSTTDAGLSSLNHASGDSNYVFVDHGDSTGTLYYDHATAAGTGLSGDALVVAQVHGGSVTATDLHFG